MPRRLAWVSFGALAMAAALEILFRVLPVSTSTETGYHIDPDILTYRPQHEFRIATGWNLANAHKFRANNLGFIAARDFTPDPNAIALIGDSFVEAKMLPEPERLGALIESLSNGRVVYAMGGPGSSLLDYATRIRYAADKLGISEFVLLLERGDVHQSLCGSGNIHGPCLDRDTLTPGTDRRPPADWIKRALRQSALAQYLFSQLKLDPAEIWVSIRETFLGKPTSNSQAPGPAMLPPEHTDTIINTFFQRISPFSPKRLVLVFDCNREALIKNKPASDPVRDRFMALARQRGATVIDTEPIFHDYLRNGSLSLNVSPTDTHWNREASRVVAESVAGILRLKH